MIAFEIDILIHNESTRMLKSIDVNFSFEALDVIPMFIHRFDAAHPFMNNGKEYTEIYLGTGTVITPMTYYEFVELYKAYNP